MTENINDARILELWFIHQLNPKLNKKRPIKKKRTKTIIVDNNLHKDIKMVQFILYDKYDMKLNLSEIIYYTIKLTTNFDIDKAAQLIIEEISKENNSKLWLK